MADYVPLDWNDDDPNTPASASRMRHMQDGIVAALPKAEAFDLFVRFVDQAGNPLPAGSTVTIRVDTTTGDIDDITFEEV